MHSARVYADQGCNIVANTLIDVYADILFHSIVSLIAARNKKMHFALSFSNFAHNDRAIKVNSAIVLDLATKRSTKRLLVRQRLRHVTKISRARWPNLPNK